MSHSLIFKSRASEFQGPVQVWWCGYGSPARLSVQVGEADEPMVAGGTELERLKNGVRSSGFSISTTIACGAIASSRNRQLATPPKSKYSVQYTKFEDLVSL